MEIDASKDVYLFVHGRSDLVEKSTAALVAKGFSTREDHPGTATKDWQCLG